MRSCAGSSPRPCRRTPAAGGVAPTRPAACRRCRSPRAGSPARSPGTPSEADDSRRRLSDEAGWRVEAISVSLTEPPEDPRARANLNPALALRVGIVGSIILGLFAIIFFRLWFLQVLSGPHYVEAAAKNTTQQVAIAPPRGEILARNGQTALVTSTTQLAAVIVPESLAVKVNPTNLLDHFPQDDAVYDRLARLLHKSTKPRPCVVAVPPPSCNTSTTKCPPSTTRDLSPIACTVAQSIALNRYADVTVAEPVSHDLEYYVAERATEFRGVEIEQATTSGYPFGPLAAQTLGTVGRLTQAEHSQPYFKGVNLNAIVGQSGLEYEYDKY